WTTGLRKPRSGSQSSTGAPSQTLSVTSCAAAAEPRSLGSTAAGHALRAASSWANRARASGCTGSTRRAPGRHRHGVPHAERPTTTKPAAPEGRRASSGCCGLLAGLGGLLSGSLLDLLSLGGLLGLLSLGCLSLRGGLRSLLLRRDGLEDELDHGHGCVVALAVADLRDAGVATLTLGDERRDLVEEHVRGVL